MEDRDKADQVTKKRKLDEAGRKAVYVNGAPKLAAFVEKKEQYQPDNNTQKKEKYQPEFLLENLGGARKLLVRL